MKNLNHIYINLFCCVFILGAISNAQNPTPAKVQSKSILINGATVHDGIGKVYTEASIGLKDGKIVFLSYLKQ